MQNDANAWRKEKKMKKEKSICIVKIKNCLLRSQVLSHWIERPGRSAASICAQSNVVWFGEALALRQAFAQAGSCYKPGFQDIYIILIYLIYYNIYIYYDVKAF